MPTTNELLDAARTLDWNRLEPLLLGLSAEDLQDRIQWLVGEIRQQGYTICRRPVQAEIARRDAFRQSVRTFLDNNNLKPIADEWREDDVAADAVEWGYHQVLASVREQVDGTLPPDRHVWAALRHLETEFAVIRQAISDWRPVDGQVLDPSAIRVTLPDGNRVQPDDHLMTLANASAATLKMLGIANHWFRESDGRLILPIQPQANPTDTIRAANVHALGVVWQVLERSDQHIRFFGGKACVQEADVTDLSGRTDRAHVLACTLDGTPIIYDQIAHERRSRMLMQFWHQLNWETAAEQNVSNATPIALPPTAFVSLEEAFADISISQFLCTTVADHEAEPGGLRIIEWVRGFASLKLFAMQKLNQGNADGPHLLDRGEIHAFLSARGLSSDKADCFIDSIIFSRQEPDLFDAPLIAVADGQLLLCTDVAGSINPVEVVLSKLATVSADLSWRGPAFEEAVRELFQTNGIAARHINRQVNGETLEVDCVVFWEGVLFVLECKSMSLSGKSNESTFRFYQEQDHAIKQVTKKRDMLLANQAILEEAFGEPLRITKTIAVVLNAMPFSLGELSEGLYVYDFSALGRFFESRHIKAIMPAKVGEHLHILRRHGFKSLWSGDHPTSDDLIHQLTTPMQLNLSLEQYDWIQVVLPLGRIAAMATWRPRRNMAGVEAELAAMGVDGERVAGEIREIHDEFSKQMQQLRQRFDQSVHDDDAPAQH